MPRLVTADGVLARRSRYGDSHAARRLITRHLDRITVLASIVANDPDEAVSLARKGFRRALRLGPPFDDALVRAFGSLAAERPDAVQARGRLLVLLVEVEQRPSSEVAALLGLDPLDTLVLLPGARASAGPVRSTRPCRGWGLVAARQQLTKAERAAGAAHLALCRRCRDRRALLDRTRAQLLGGSAALGAVAATQVFPFGSPVGLTFAALGAKGGPAMVAVLGSAVLATASTVAVVEPARFEPGTSTPQQTVVSVPSQSGTPLPSPAPTLPVTPSSISSPALPTMPVPLPTAVPRTRAPLPLPTSLPTLPVPLPTLPALPLPLPTLPVPLPTKLELPLDLP